MRASTRIFAVRVDDGRVVPPPAPAMSDLPLRARSATEIIDAAFQLYKRHALQFILVTGLAYAPWLVVQLTFLRNALTVTPGSSAMMSVSMILNMLGSFIIISLMGGVLIRLGSRAYLNGEPGDLSDAVRDVLPKVFKIIGATIARSVIMGVGMLAVLFAAPLALINPALVFLGFIPACAWLAYFYARFSASTSVIVLEDAGVDRSLSRSSVLTRGRKWHVLGTYAILWLVYGMLWAGVAVFFTFTQSVVIQTVISTVLTIVAYPIIGLAEMLIYYDLRIRKEGFDIEVMAGALDATSPRVAS
jgi:hypothetical protein